MVDDKKTDKSVESNWLDEHNLNELIDTTNLNILPKYDMIPKDDLITTRKVVIVSLPKAVSVEKDGTMLNLQFITISDNGITFSLPFNSKALQRSLISLAIKESKAIHKKDIDFSKILGKMYGLKREQFTTKGYTQSPLKFYRLDK